MVKRNSTLYLQADAITQPVRGYRDIQCLAKTRKERWELGPHCYLFCGLTCAKKCNRYCNEEGICEGCPCNKEEN
jgi:hypothetical protein